MRCPRCDEHGVDPHPAVHTDTLCCGQSTDCGGNKCTGPEPLQEVSPQPCTLCGGTRFVLPREALAYVLEGGS